MFFQAGQEGGGGGMWNITGMTVDEDKRAVRASVVKEGFLDEGE